MQNVVLIGGSGFLGSFLLQELLKEDFFIYAVKNKSEIPLNQKIKIIKGGIKALDSDKLQKIKPEYIFHCARPTLSRFKKLGRKVAALKAYSLNKNLLKQIKKSGVQTKLVFASGSLAYGNSKGKIDEQTPLKPISYSRDYIKGENPITKDKGNKNLTILTLRLPWMIGNDSWFKWFYKNNLNESGQIPLFGSGNNIMSLIDAEDAAQLLLSYAKRAHHSRVYNVFSPFQLTQKAFVNQVQQVMGGEIVDYNKIYPKLEKAALEAFRSDIQLSTNYPEILGDYSFTSIEETLEKLK
jgi:nucleoside-diphosphate-sugar epimerase